MGRAAHRPGAIGGVLFTSARPGSSTTPQDLGRLCVACSSRRRNSRRCGAGAAHSRHRTPQHMYGFESTVMLPLQSGAAWARRAHSFPPTSPRSSIACRDARPDHHTRAPALAGCGRHCTAGSRPDRFGHGDAACRSGARSGASLRRAAAGNLWLYRDGEIAARRTHWKSSGGSGRGKAGDHRGTLLGAGRPCGAGDSACR